VGKSAQAFRTISEAAIELELPQHVLRFWETRFPQIKPLKRGGGRRYYRPDDVMLLKGIQHLLYDQGYTIKGVQRILKEEGPRKVISIGDAGGVEVRESDSVASDSVASSGIEHGSGSVTSSNTIVSTNATPLKISGRGRAKLTNVMRELLECKRLLDRARE